MNPKKEAFRKAFIASVPILCSYLFLGLAYGILMQEAGFGWAASLLTSAVVYTGAFRAHYVPSQWYPGGLCQLLAVAVTALLHKWKHNTFLSIILGTAVYMLLIRIL